MNNEKDNDKAIQLAKKLLALAERGVGGEKINAQESLNRLLEKHNITLDQISDEKKETHIFWTCKQHLRLFNQIVSNINSDLKKARSIVHDFTRNHRKYLCYEIECTKIESVMITENYIFYRELYVEEEYNFYVAFIHKNELLSSSTKEDSNDNDISYDPFKVGMFMDLIKRRKPVKLIE